METIPSSKDIKIKPKFEERYKKLLDKDYDDFLKYSFYYLTKCIRVNTLKISVKDLKKRLEKKWELQQIPWTEGGFKIFPKKSEDKPSRYDVGNLIEHTLGYIYIQEAASMLPAIVLNPKPGDFVLDMCAAPGSKTTQLAEYMNNQGLLIANDVKSARLKALGINIQRMGVKNTLLTLSSGVHLKFNDFDKILVDAPCSGTGTIRKSFKVLEMWSQGLVSRLAREQYTLLKKAFNLLKTEGILVYSTCTLEPEENEAVVSRLLNEFENAKILPINLKINRSKPKLKFEKLNIRPELKHALRIHPQDNNSEGFFVVKIKKE